MFVSELFGLVAASKGAALRVNHVDLLGLTILVRSSRLTFQQPSFADQEMNPCLVGGANVPELCVTSELWWTV